MLENNVPILHILEYTMNLFGSRNYNRVNENENKCITISNGITVKRSAWWTNVHNDKMSFVTQIWSTLKFFFHQNIPRQKDLLTDDSRIRVHGSSTFKSCGNIYNLINAIWIWECAFSQVMQQVNCYITDKVWDTNLPTITSHRHISQDWSLEIWAKCQKNSQN